MEKLKVIVAHPGKQHSFQLATGLNRDGMLFKYITTVYDKKNSILMKATRFFLSDNDKKRAFGRRCEGLRDEQVVQFCQLRSMVTLLLVRLDKSRKIYNAWNQLVANSFSRKVANYAIRNKVDAVIMYDSSAEKCFEILEKRAPQIKRILDASCANRAFVKQIYEEDMQRSPLWAKTLKSEKEFLWKYPLDGYVHEGQLATGILAASNFVKRSYTVYGVDANRIHIVPYGVDVSNFQPIAPTKHEEIRFIFVGGVRQMKGISYLLEAFTKLHAEFPMTQLEIVGDCHISDNLLKPYKDIVLFSGYLLHNEVAERLHQADVFVFPSLADGFGLAGIEAMGSGLPMIVSDNSGISDIITDECSFVVRTGDCTALYEKMRFFCQNPEYIQKMGAVARKVAKSCTWENYYQNIQIAVKDICNQ